MTTSQYRLYEMTEPFVAEFCHPKMALNMPQPPPSSIEGLQHYSFASGHHLVNRSMVLGHSRLDATRSAEYRKSQAPSQSLQHRLQCQRSTTILSVESQDREAHLNTLLASNSQTAFENRPAATRYRKQVEAMRKIWIEAMFPPLSDA